MDEGGKVGGWVDEWGNQNAYQMGFFSQSSSSKLVRVSSHCARTASGPPSSTHPLPGNSSFSISQHVAQAASSSSEDMNGWVGGWVGGWVLWVRVWVE